MTLDQVLLTLVICFQMAAKLGANEIVENIIQLALEKPNNNTSVSKVQCNTTINNEFIEYLFFVCVSVSPLNNVI